jgi:hypothetical protein
MSARPVTDSPNQGDHKPEGSRAVFLSDFVHIGVPFERLASVLLDESAAWLQDLGEETTSGNSWGDQIFPPGVVRTKMRVSVAGKRPGPTVAITAGPPRVHDQQVIVPISWEPISFERLLPKLEADLELSALGESDTRLAINGRYRVPLGPLGLNLDRVAMHRVAESSLRRFLLEVQDSLLLER